MGLNSEFFFSLTGCHTKVKKTSLPIAGGSVVGLIPFPRLLMLCETQTASSRFELSSTCTFPMMITIIPLVVSGSDGNEEVFQTP